MSSCIIFSCTILNESRLFVLQEFLDSFRQHFIDADIYVGLNYNTIPQAKSLIEKSGLNIASLDYSSLELYSESDASAYQTALNKLKCANKEYDTYWFIHTKGGVNSHSDYLREWYCKTFISNRTEIELFLQSNPDIGSYGKLGLEYDYGRDYGEVDCDITLFKNDITDQLPCTHHSFFYIHSLYVITKKPMEKFLSLTSNIWFNTKLDRYYFEGVFPFIVSRSGYFPYIENQISAAGADLSYQHLDWIINNQLQNKYIHLHNQFKTNYSFHQLNPPYVNSNS